MILISLVYFYTQNIITHILDTGKRKNMRKMKIFFAQILIWFFMIFIISSPSYNFPTSYFRWFSLTFIYFFMVSYVLKILYIYTLCVHEQQNLVDTANVCNLFIILIFHFLTQKIIHLPYNTLKFWKMNRARETARNFKKYLQAGLLKRTDKICEIWSIEIDLQIVVVLRWFNLLLLRFKNLPKIIHTNLQDKILMSPKVSF